MHTKKRAQQPPEYLVVGRVVRPHGTQGALIVEALSPLIRSIDPETDVLLGDAGTQRRILGIRPHRDRYLVNLAGCSTRDQAELYRGLEILLPFDQAEPLPQGEYYYWQILGLRVVTLSGDHLGEVAEILETGANDVYIVRDEQDTEILIPAIPSVIKRVDLEEGILQVELLPGLLDS